MVIDFGDDKAAFWRAYQGKGKRQRRKAQELRADIPRAGRAGRGEGGRERDLAELAAAGFMPCQVGEQHYLVNPRTGAETPRRSSYKDAIDAALALLGGRQEG